MNALFFSLIQYKIVMLCCLCTYLWLCIILACVICINEWHSIASTLCLLTLPRKKFRRYVTVTLKTKFKYAHPTCGYIECNIKIIIMMYHATHHVMELDWL